MAAASPEATFPLSASRIVLSGTAVANARAQRAAITGIKEMTAEDRTISVLKVGGRPPRTLGITFVFVSGCGVIPSVNILGSFFPAWLISIVTGVVLTVLTRQAFLIARIAPYVRPAAVAYGCLILLWTLATWLVVFAS